MGWVGLRVQVRVRVRVEIRLGVEFFVELCPGYFADIGSLCAGEGSQGTWRSPNLVFYTLTDRRQSGDCRKEDFLWEFQPEKIVFVPSRLPDLVPPGDGPDEEKRTDD